MKSARHTQGTIALNNYVQRTGVSYTAIAASLGVTGHAVYGWLRGTSRPRIELWPQIERLTDGSVPVIAWTQAIEPSASPSTLV